MVSCFLNILILNNLVFLRLMVVLDTRNNYMFWILPSYFCVRIQNVRGLFDTFGYSPAISEGVSKIPGAENPPRNGRLSTEIDGKYPQISNPKSNMLGGYNRENRSEEASSSYTRRHSSPDAPELVSKVVYLFLYIIKIRQPI